MTTAVAAPTVPGAPASTGPMSSLRWLASDTVTLTRRNLLAVTRIPEALFFSTVQPIMFVLLFRYVFGGAINVGSVGQGHYVNFLIPGILVQTTMFGAIGTAIGLAEDLQKGLIERFKALPMTRLAVLGGRTVADLARNVFVLLIITGIGFLVGFRPGGGFIHYVEASLLMLLFAYSFSWAFAYIGLAAPNSETAQAMAFPIIFPLTFASGVFVPVYYMPGWLQAFANNQPVSHAAQAVRALMLGGPVGDSVWLTVVWSVGLLVVLTPIATARYRRAA
ncbi:MAG: ABC transporter permease [Acidobacteriota bacterium]|nr:ABC transporter permease [Acidobacteriota bacterium]